MRSRRELFMMGALVEIDRAGVMGYGRKRNFALDDAPSRLLDEIKRAGRESVAQTGQKLSYVTARVDSDRPATVATGAGFSGDRERAVAAFDRWNEALAEQGTILRAYLHGSDIHRERVEEGFEKELEHGLWSDQEAIRQAIEPNRGASAERGRLVRTWWRDWEWSARHPWTTRLLLAASLAFFGAYFGVAIARLDAWWSVLFATLAGALGGLGFGEYGIRRWSDERGIRSLDDADRQSPRRRHHDE